MSKSKQPGKTVGDHYKGVKRGPKEDATRAPLRADGQIGGVPVTRSEGRAFLRAMEAYGVRAAGGFRGWHHFFRALLRREALLVLKVEELHSLGVPVDDADLDALRALYERARFALLRVAPLRVDRHARDEPVPVAFVKFGLLASDPLLMGEAVDLFNGLATLAEIAAANELGALAEGIRATRERLGSDLTAVRAEAELLAVLALLRNGREDETRAGVARSVILAEVARLLEPFAK